MVQSGAVWMFSRRTPAAMSCSRFALCRSTSACPSRVGVKSASASWNFSRKASMTSRADFVAAARPPPGRWPRARRARSCPYSALMRSSVRGDDCGERPAPSSVNRGARARSRVAEDDGHAVGGLDAEQDAPVSSSSARRNAPSRERGSTASSARRARRCRAPASRRRASIRRRRVEKAAAVLVYVLGRVFVEAREVERILRHRAHAAAARRESVGETHRVRAARTRARAPLRFFRASENRRAPVPFIIRDHFHRHRHYRSPPRA